MYHLSPDNGIAVRDLVELICKKMNVSFKEVAVEVAERLGQDKAYIIDSSKARKELQWKPVIGIEDGIASTIDWIVSNFREIKKEPLAYVHKE